MDPATIGAIVLASVALVTAIARHVKFKSKCSYNQSIDETFAEELKSVSKEEDSSG